MKNDNTVKLTASTFCFKTATKDEVSAALKLVELLYNRGEIPQHVYRNICKDYYGKGVDRITEACYTVNTPRQDAV